MRVLHLPVNIASIPSHTVRGLQEIGVEARGLIISNHKIQSSKGLKVVGKLSERKLLLRVKWITYFLKSVLWADVVHWYFGTLLLPRELELRFLKFIKKPGVVSWLGSDIRIPEVEFEDNPYYRNVFFKGYEYPYESKENSIKLQRLFADAGFAAIVTVDMKQYIQDNLWAKVYTIYPPIMLSDFQPCYPERENLKPLIIHSPSAPNAKGTQYVLKAIDKLKTKYDFEFKLIHNTPIEQAHKIMQKADIFLDQFILGAYGMATVEAMAFGKPVLCYIKPSLQRKYPKDLPIVNATIDDLEDKIEWLLQDAKRRYEIGKLSRTYVEKYHDATKVAHQLVGVYQEVIENKKHHK